MAITEKSKRELLAVTNLDTFSDDKVSKSFYLICEELAYKYYGTSRLSKEKKLQFMINLLWQAGHDANDDKFMDWYAGVYSKFTDMLDSREDELPDDDDYFSVYCD